MMLKAPNPSTHQSIAAERVKRRQMLAKVATACEVVQTNALVDHQRLALDLLRVGTAVLTRSEASFLRRVRESRIISERQAHWLRELAPRIEWEAAHADL